MAGLAALFTRDFFAIAKNRLDEDGIFVQWLQSYEMDWSTFALVGRTFAEVFPNSLLVMTSPSVRGQDYLLVGLKGSQQLALDRAKQKLSCIQQSRNVTLRDPRLLYRLMVSEDLHRLFGQGPVNTDNRPRLEFAAPKLMQDNDPMIEKEIADKKWLSPETRNIVQQVTTNLDAQIDFAAYAVSLYEPFCDMVDLSKATPSQKERFFRLMETYAAKILIDYSIFRDDRLKQRCSSIQIETIEKNIELMPDKSLSYSYLGNLYYAEDMLDEAIANYSKSLQIEPGFASAHYNLARTLVEVDEIPAAITHLKEALRLRPNWVSPMNNLAWLLATYENPKFRDGSEALQLAEQACKSTNYEKLELLGTLAAAYAAAGRFSQAVAAAEDGLELAQSSGREELTEEIQNCLRLYEAGRPYSVPFPKLSSN